MAKTNSVELQLAEILDEYEDRVADVSQSAINHVADEAVQKLKNTSPRRPSGGEYANGWEVKSETSTGRGTYAVVVHNVVYRLTHLLENGHVIRNKYGTFGRVRAIKHIKPVEEWAKAELPREIEKELR